MSQSVKKITSYLFALRVLRMFLSMVTLIFSAKYFGISLERDVWILVTTVLTTVTAAIWGPVNETFRTKFIFIRESEGESVAVRKTSSLLGFVIFFTVLTSLLLVFFSGRIGNFVTGDLPSESLSIFLKLFLILIPTFLINELTSLCISVLNAYDVFYVPELAGAITGILNLLIIVCLAPAMGIYSLVVSQYVSILLLLIIVLFYVKKLNLRIFSGCFRVNFSHVKVFLLFSLPFFFPYFVGQLNLFVEKWLAGTLGQGYISSVDYARQFTVVLQGVMTSVLATVMVPMLAKLYAQRKSTEYTFILKENVTTCFFILSLIIPILLGAAKPLCYFFFLKGEMTPDAVDRIIDLTRIYAVSFIGITLYLIFGFGLLSSDKGKVYAICGVVAQVITLLLNLMFYSSLSVYIFPLSVGISHFLLFIVMASFLSFGGNKRFIYFIITKYIIVIFALSLLLSGFNAIFTLENNFIQLLLSGFLLLLVIPVLAKIFGVDIRKYLKKNR